MSLEMQELLKKLSDFGRIKLGSLKKIGPPYTLSFPVGNFILRKEYY